MAVAVKKARLSAGMSQRTRMYTGVQEIIIDNERGRLLFEDGRLVCVRYTPRLVRPKDGEFHEYGSERTVLARRSFDLELWWQQGHSWKDGWHSSYSPAELTAVESSQGFDLVTPEGVIERDLTPWGGGVKFMPKKAITEGGRLSLARLLEHWQEIDAFFGVPGLTALLDPKRTAVVE